MKDITGYEGLYAVTSCGKVWSHTYKKFLKPGKQPNGYLKVYLSKNNVQTNYYIHRLVAQTYLANPEGLPDVNHLNECKSDNYTNNLAWAAHKENVNYGTGIQRCHAKQKKSIYCIELNKTFESTLQAAQFINKSASLICNCLKGKKKTAGGYHWRYA